MPIEPVILLAQDVARFQRGQMFFFVGLSVAVLGIVVIILGLVLGSGKK